MLAEFVEDVVIVVVLAAVVVGVGMQAGWIAF